jgi:hypothetical protein
MSQISRPHKHHLDQVMERCRQSQRNFVLVGICGGFPVDVDLRGTNYFSVEFWGKRENIFLCVDFVDFFWGGREVYLFHVGESCEI